jgi:pilus assembly protein CpaD
MLYSQGRLQAQSLSITPFNARGEALATRLAQALVRAGARPPIVKPRPGDAARLKEAQDNTWDLELQSEAMVVSLPECRVARPDELMLRPYEGVGRLGCATRANLAAMVSDPRDLLRPRTLDGANGAAAVAAVTRYQEGDTRDLIDLDFKD